MGEFVLSVPLRWSDMDAYGHVNHANYLTYLEEARDAALSAALGIVSGETGYVVARLEIDYRQELRNTDGPATVRIAFTTLGTASLRTRETIHSAAGVLAVESAAVIVKFDRETRASAPWNAEERAAFTNAGATPRA
ncbi:MAG: thioesterase family protein [Thermomicrobiales bacterium]